VTLVLVVAIPFATALAIAILGGRLGRRILGAITVAGLALSFGAGASMISALRERPSLEASIGSWLPLTGADLALVVDSSMLAVALAITGVSALIALYSIDYLAHDRYLQRYFASFALLVGGMLLVVLASNLLLLVAGLQLAGVAGYLLVGHHSTDGRADATAARVLIIGRIGDAAILAGALVLFTEFHTVDIAQLGGAALEHGSTVGSAPAIASVLLLIGAVARSAQAPLHVWLPDSAESTTPVSALLQTVAVTGGVILLMRLRSILVPDVLQAAAIVGGVTALGAAVVAIAQRDVRRILAWSTISQVGLMFVAAGLGALFAARFQLIAHALLKAVLVLGAGSVRRMTGDVSDVAAYGGLVSRMRWTAGAFGVGTLALAGLPPAAGFFGVAAIASAAFSESDVLLTAVVLAAAGVSAFAGVRLFALMFVAPRAGRPDVDEPPPLQDIPLAILALGALGFGVIVNAGILPIGSGPADTAPLWLVILTFGVAMAASVAAWLAYRHGIVAAARIERTVRWAGSGLGFDALYARGIARPFAGLAGELERGAERTLSDAIDGVGALGAWSSRAIAHRTFDGRAQQVLLAVSMVVLLAFWTWSGR
jgi:NADH-quinone oxidoreductase subunit L